MPFSVLLSLYKKESPIFLRQSLDSLFNQTLLPSEVVLVLDGPIGDELNEVVEDYRNHYSILKVYPQKVNKGLGKALNIGLNKCQNELVARMDTDDIAKPERFEKQIAFLEEHPEIDALSCWIDEFEDNVTNIKSTRKLPESPNELFEYAKKRCPLNHPSVVFRKSAVERAGNYQPFPLFEDYFLWVRMLMNGSKFYNLQESLLWFRTSPEMFKRRGGWKYALDELRLQKGLRKIGFINYTEYLKNITIRFTVRIMPNNLRTFVYKKLLR
ncbi:MAG: glycosyltransferase [Ruminococcus sp.]|nr:glycosyltransferase [Ruminococcus sp.]